MSEEHRDPDLQALGVEWQAPPPSPELHSRTLAAFEAEFGRAPWWRPWLLPVAVACAIPIVVLLFSHARTANRYEPVRQPHFVVLTAGEHP